MLYEKRYKFANLYLFLYLYFVFDLDNLLATIFAYKKKSAIKPFVVVVIKCLSNT